MTRRIGRWHVPSDPDGGRATTSMPGARKSEGDAMAWMVVGAIALFTWLALASGGRLPAVDLPQHALALRRLLEGPGDLFVVRWEFPYLLIYALAALPAQWTDPVNALTWTASFTMALLPIASASLAESLGRSPAFGAFGLLGAFTMVSGWGFFAVMLSASVFAFALSAALAYARQRTLGRGLVLVLVLVLSYWAHPVGWLVTLSLAWIVVPLWRRQLVARELWPLALGTLVTGALCLVWQLREVAPWLARVSRTQPLPSDGPFPYRVLALPQFASAFGRLGELVAPWALLAAVLVVTVLWGAARRRHALRRADSWALVRAARSAPMRPRVLRFLQRSGPVLVWWALVALYLVVPVWIGGVFMVYPRFLVFAGVLAPVLVGARHTRRARPWALAATVPAVWLATVAALEVRHNAERTRCIDRLAADVRPGEATLTLSYRLYPEGYLQPLDLHVGAELAALRGGWVDHTFTDRATLPIAYAPGVDREVVPSSLGPDATRYDHARHGGEFTQWVLVDPPAPADATVTRVFGRGPYEAASCDWLTVVRDVSVAPGSRPHRRYLPHRTTLGAGGP